MVFEVDDIFPESKKDKKPMNIWQILTFVFAAVLVISLIGNFTTGFAAFTGDIGDKVVKFTNDNLLRPGTTATLKGVESKHGVYKVTVEVSGQDAELYTTKGGELLFTSAILMDEDLQSVEEEPAKEIPKTAKPTVDMYVMSFCPFGNKGEDTMYPVYNLLKDKVNWNIRYIVSANGDTISSLHGQPEVDQDVREVCVKKNYGMDAFWKFVTKVNSDCGSDGKCWESAAKDAGADVEKIKKCAEEEGTEFMKKEAAAAEKAGASGSPTLIINGVKSSSVYSYGKSETYKQAICSAFSEAPEECKETLSTAATGAAGSC